MSLFSEISADAPINYLRLSSGRTDIGSAGSTWSQPFGQDPTYGQTSLIATDTADKSALFGSGNKSILIATNAPTATSCSLEAWFKPVTLSGSTQYLFSAQGGVGFAYTSSQLVWYTAGNFGPSASKSCAISAGSIYHAVVTYDRPTKVATLYLNGVSLGTTTMTSAGDPQWSASTALGIGINPGAGSGVDAYLDEMAIYSSVLSGARVSAHYNAGNSAAKPVIFTAAGLVQSSGLKPKIYTAAGRVQ